MKRLTMLVFLLAIVALPAGVLGAQGQHKSLDDPQQKKEKSVPEKKEKSVPEPAAMLLVGAGAAAYVGLRKVLRRNDG